MIRKTAAAIAGAVLLTSCGQTTVGVAARVGERSIETSSFAARVARAYENENFAQQQPKDAYQRSLLGSLIINRIVRVAADRRNITVSDADVDARVKSLADQVGGMENLERQAAAQGVAKDDVRTAVADRLLQDAVMDDLVKDVEVTEKQMRDLYQQELAQFDTAEIAHILMRDANRAKTVAAEAKKPGADFAALAVKNSEDTDTSANGGQLGTIGNGEGKYAKEFEAAVFTAKTGDVVGPVKTVTQGDAKVVGYEIIKVVKRTTRSFAEVSDELRRTLLSAQREQRFNVLLTDLQRELGVKVNPRFGRWDGQRFTVVAADDGGLSSPSPEPGAVQPGGVLPGSVPTAAPTP